MHYLKSWFALPPCTSSSCILCSFSALCGASALRGHGAALGAQHLCAQPSARGSGITSVSWHSFARGHCSFLVQAGGTCTGGHHRVADSCRTADDSQEYDQGVFLV